ncbi:MAG: hypothetical protein PHX43_09505 [Alphaproteobacteria bacterium]|nr:hypothetical protein [Alphaproteobacteria bacterium]
MKAIIDKAVLFQLIASHSKLSQAEYNRNPAYNNTHFSHIAEESIIKELRDEGLWEECMEFLTGGKKK